MFNLSDLHPMVVHFPIALIIVGFFADLSSLFFKKEKCLSRAGLYLMVLGTLAAVVAYTTGQLFADEPTEGEIVKVFEKHETGALITIIIMLIGSALRIYLIKTGKDETRLKWAVFSTYLLGFLSVSFTGYMGGTMVYNYMLGF